MIGAGLLHRFGFRFLQKVRIIETSVERIHFFFSRFERFLQTRLLRLYVDHAFEGNGVGGVIINKLKSNGFSALIFSSI